MAAFDISSEVRQTAIARIRFQDSFAFIAFNTRFEEEQTYALKRLNCNSYQDDITQLILKSTSDETSSIALEKLVNPAHLAKVAKNGTSIQIRLDAIDKVLSDSSSSDI